MGDQDSKKWKLEKQWCNSAMEEKQNGFLTFSSENCFDKKEELTVLHVLKCRS
jgi:hypothetical protein